MRIAMRMLLPGLTLALAGCLFGTDDESISEEWGYRYKEDWSIKDTIMVWDLFGMDEPDTAHSWMKTYSSDSVMFDYRYSIQHTKKGVVLEDLALNLYFVVPSGTDTFHINALYPDKVMLTRVDPGGTGFRPVLEATISGNRTGTNSWHAAGRVIYSLSLRKDPDSVSAAGRDTVSFQGTFKPSPYYYY
jgi:hypothetical protein